MVTDMMSAFDAVMNEGLLVEEAKKADAFPLIPSGKYPATLVKVEDRSNDQKEVFDDGSVNPLYGKPVANLQVKLEGVSDKGYNELDGSTRTHFIKVCPAVVYNKAKEGKEARLSAPSRLAGQMIAVSGTAGKSFTDTLAWFQENRFQVSISQFKGGDGEMRNNTAAISALA